MNYLAFIMGCLCRPLPAVSILSTKILTKPLDNRGDVDIVVIGEEKKAIKDLVGLFSGQRKRNEIIGIVYRDGQEMVRTKEKAPLADFDQLPIPDFSLLGYAKNKIYRVGRVRGCGMDCEFWTVKGKDAELLRAMRAAGISNVPIGFESPIPEELKAMLTFKGDGYAV
jgi:radical SAM superfamily enzyme YgiQ (UPF0313 family)